jgi:hypothetical protein
MVSHPVREPDWSTLDLFGRHLAGQTFHRRTISNDARARAISRQILQAIK